jgi:hypothetical protein
MAFQAWGAPPPGAQESVGTPRGGRSRSRPWGRPGGGGGGRRGGGGWGRGGGGGGALAIPKWCPRDRDRDREEGPCCEPGRALGWVILSATPPTTHPGESLECVPSPWEQIPGSAQTPFNAQRVLAANEAMSALTR